MSLRPNINPLRVQARPKLGGSLISLLRLDQNRRKYYRVVQAGVPSLTVSIPRSVGEPFLGVCQDISLGGAGVRFAAGHDPELAVGTELVLSFRQAAVSLPLNVRARVVSALPLDSTVKRYNFWFPHPDEISPYLNATWARYFNRRRHVRVAPETSMHTCLRWPLGEANARVHNLSVSGVAVLVDLAQAANLRSVPLVHLTLNLPDEDGPQRLKAFVRSIRLVEHDGLIGLEFERNAQLERALDPLQRYLERRMVRSSGGTVSPRG
jgi:hypothetical protein